VTDPRIVWEQFHDHERFCRESLAIRDKNGKTVPFVLQPAQRKLHELIARCRARKKPVRIVVLKARQVMISTGAAAEFFHEVPFHPGQRALIVAHEKDASKNIYGYYSQLIDNYQPFAGAIGLPPVERRADDRGYVKWTNNSELKVATANNIKTGRSASLRFLHLSEFAFWRDARTLMTGLMQCVPDDPDTCVIVESTANGVGGPFYSLCMEAMDPSSGSEWEFLFFAWWEHPEYKRAVVDKPALQRSLTKDELNLAEGYRLTLEQLHWRRWAIKNKCQGSPEIFKQEYPACPEEAFLFTGRPRLSHAHLGRMPVINDPAVGELLEVQNGPRVLLAFQQSDRGALVLFKRPQPNKQYVIGVDVAEGVDPAAKAALGDSDPDYSVAIVADRDTGEQVAKLRGRIEPAPFAEYVCALGRWFNWAYLIPECNGPGIAFLEGVLRDNYPPSLIYHRRPLPDEQFKDEASTSLQMLGWRNTAVTRVQLISKLDQAIREFSIILHDANTIREHQTFVIKPNGRAEAQEGAHDDEVIATALAVVGLETPPPDARLQPLKANAPREPHGGTVRSYGTRRLPDSETRERDRGRILRF
jgi:hypothetical protein